MQVSGQLEVPPPRFLSVSPVAPTVSPLTTPPLSPRDEGYDSEATIEDTSLNGQNEDNRNDSPAPRNALGEHPVPQYLNLNEDFNPAQLDAVVQSADSLTASHLRPALVEQLVYDTIMVQNEQHTTVEAALERQRELKRGDIKRKRKRSEEKTKLEELIEALETMKEQDEEAEKGKITQKEEGAKEDKAENKKDKAEKKEDNAEKKDEDSGKTVKRPRLRITCKGLNEKERRMK
ncbi:hypothetical protein TWF730_009966 [Orbilia blumenaviensis]|uniref:Uncharacterized protein n=1 Tax=Orbilia blumenaviensis TaxID=1796055 RepID=A0AAV9UTB3_9PEZI